MELSAWTLRFFTGGSATELSATDAWLSAVVGDESHVGIICELVRQVHDRACNNAAAVPIVRRARALARQDARMRQMMWAMVRPRW